LPSFRKNYLAAPQREMKTSWIISTNKLITLTGYNEPIVFSASSH
jgi:hypothetical protein